MSSSTGASSVDRRYDVVVAGARVAGASTAMLLARAGLRVLVVDPTARGRDTLSTHALMRAGVAQLSRWGLLDRVRAAGTPRVDETTFVYETEVVTVPVEPDALVDGLYAPRRTVLDPILADAAMESGAELRWGWRLVDLDRTPNGHVVGARLRAPDGAVHLVRADLVVGADGLHSQVARLVGARTRRTARHATATIFGYWAEPASRGYRWLFGHGVAAGVIPTNGGVLVFAGMPPSRLHAERARGLDAIHAEVLREVSPELEARLRASGAAPKLRAFAGVPGHVRESAGPGWALVGDSGYYKDPLTAHGMTDALRDAELLARAVVNGRSGPDTLDDALLAYEARRDDLSLDLFAVTDEIASLRWSQPEVQRMHRDLSRGMKAEVEEIRRWERQPAAA